MARTLIEFAELNWDTEYPSINSLRENYVLLATTYLAVISQYFTTERSFDTRQATSLPIINNHRLKTTDFAEC